MKNKISIICIVFISFLLIIFLTDNNVIERRESTIKIDKNYTYTVNYPSTNLENLNIIIVNKINDDINNFVNEYENIDSTTKHELFIDYELYNINNELLSIKLTKHINTLLNDVEIVENKVINYDLKQNKELSNNELFNTDIIDDIKINEMKILFTYKNIVLINDNDEFKYSYNDVYEYLLNKKSFLNIKESSNNHVPVINEIDFSINTKLSKNDKMIALTFDDGPHYKYTNEIVETLKKYNSYATFFVVGNKVASNSTTVKNILKNGNEIGNHTFTHRNLVYLNASKIDDEIKKCNEEVYLITGYMPKIVRPTYGITNKVIKNTIKEPLVLWNIDPEDWKYKNSDYIINNILKNVDDGDIILLHDMYKHTALTVEKLVPLLIEEGYKLVTISDLYYYKKDKLISNKIYIE